MTSLTPSNYKKIPINDEDNEEELALNLSKEDANDLRGGMYAEYSRSNLHSDSRSYSHSLSSPPDTAIDYEYNSPDRSTRSIINSPKSDNDGHNNGDSYDSDEEDLGRYAIDFNQTLGRSQNKNGYGYEQAAGTSHFHFDRKDSKRRWTQSSPVREFFHIIQDARMETRTRRLERLLALPDEATMQFHKERCALFLGTWCNLLDKGFIPILFMLVIYVVVLSTLDAKHAFVKNIMLGFGIPIFIFRITWRPLCWLVRERLQERRVRVSTSIASASTIFFLCSSHSIPLFLHHHTQETKIDCRFSRTSTYSKRRFIWFTNKYPNHLIIT